MPEDIDSAIDRLEFEKRLRSCSNWCNHYTQKQVFDALLDEDAVKIAEIRACKDACEAWIQKDLAAWDAAQDEAERRAVVGSVTSYEKPL